MAYEYCKHLKHDVLFNTMVHLIIQTCVIRIQLMESAIGAVEPLRTVWTSAAGKQDLEKPVRISRGRKQERTS